MLVNLQNTVNKLVSAKEQASGIGASINSTAGNVEQSSESENVEERDNESEDWCANWDFPFNNVEDTISLDSELGKNPRKQRSLVSNNV
jgi:hypothetical protein